LQKPERNCEKLSLPWELKYLRRKFRDVPFVSAGSQPGISLIVRSILGYTALAVCKRAYRKKWFSKEFVSPS
jgi:hypothetical protein